jgi:predicted nuclease of predicted toxin-antitoxin system
MIKFYFDVHVPKALLKSARARGLDVITSQEDGTRTADDEHLLRRATALGRVLVTQDKDFEGIVARALKAGEEFTGVIAVRARKELALVTADLELVARAESPEALKEKVFYIPI